MSKVTVKQECQREVSNDSLLISGRFSVQGEDPQALFVGLINTSAEMKGLLSGIPGVDKQHISTPSIHAHMVEVTTDITGPTATKEWQKQGFEAFISFAILFNLDITRAVDSLIKFIIEHEGSFYAEQCLSDQLKEQVSLSLARSLQAQAVEKASALLGLTIPNTKLNLADVSYGVQRGDMVEFGSARRSGHSAEYKFDDALLSLVNDMYLRAETYTTISDSAIFTFET